MKNPNMITAVSYSRYRDYTKCPLFAKLKHIDKLKEPDSPAMARGTEIHKLAEDYVMGKLKHLPSELSLMKRHFEALRALPYKEAEASWAFASNYEPLPDLPQDFSKFRPEHWAVWRRIFLRVKMDLSCHNIEDNLLMVVDYKTGKFREYELGSYEEQLEIYGMGGLLRYPDVAGVSPRMWYIDAGLQYPEPEDTIYYWRKDLPRLLKLWTQKFKPMLCATKFPPKPNDKCRFCHFRKDNDGPCPY